VATMYFKDFHLLLLGVICLATSIEKWGLHRRIALKLVTMIGVNPGMLMLGFMVGCAFLSMWLSNTSTAAMVMPIAEAVMQQVMSAEGEVSQHQEMAVNSIYNLALQLEGDDEKQCERFKDVKRFYPDCKSINFGNWFVFSLPVCIIVLFSAWIWLYWLFLGTNFRSMLCSRGGQSEREIAAAKLIKDQYNALGPMSRQEIITLVIFFIMAVLWFVREPGFMPGWASLFPEYPGYATDATVALLLGVLFFIIPANRPTADNYDAMITWKEFQACMPWEICLLVGGGFALAEGAKVSGLSSWVAELMTPLGSLPVLATVTIACILVTCITEVASNPATITIFLPILAPLAEAININPLYMLIPTTLSVSFAFLLPVSNPPNAIAFAYGHLSIIDMVKAGLGLNIIGVLAVLLAISTWGTSLFALDTYPDWAPIHDLTNTTGI
ncbi:hypothetical protein P4O66_015698, partial [Electrophorus voltai]